MSVQSRLAKVERARCGDMRGFDLCRGFKHISVIEEGDTLGERPGRPDEVWCPRCGRDCVLVIHVVYDDSTKPNSEPLKPLRAGTADGGAARQKPTRTKARDPSPFKGEYQLKSEKRHVTIRGKRRT